MMDYIIKIISVLVATPLMLILCLVFGSLIRWINEGDNYKNPMDSQRPIDLMFKDKEFYKTLMTGVFVVVTLFYLFGVL